MNSIKRRTALALFVFLAGCGQQRPDYVKPIAPAQLNEVLAKQDVFLVDVHIPEQRHIQGTDLFIPYNEVEKYADRLPTDKNTPIYLYCRSGPMADKAAKTLHDLGYTNLTNLEGGAEAWGKSGFAFQ
jgi:rhodanese-related sulfurtransferase